MLTATAASLLQTELVSPESLSPAVAGLAGLTVVAFGAAALGLWNRYTSTSGEDEQPAMQPVPSEETERHLIHQQDTETPGDHVAQQRLQYLTSVTRDDRT